MALNPERSELGFTDDYDYNRSQTITTSTSTDELASTSALARGAAGEMLVIQALQRFMRPIFIPIFRPLIRQFVEEEFELAKLEVLTSMKDNPDNKACTSALKRLKLQFRNRVAVPVFTGMALLGENQKPIEIALVDALTEQIVNTGPESTAHLEIRGFPVGDHDGCWTCEHFQERIPGGKKGRRILQGETYLQLKEGICFISKLSFTHTSEHTKNGNYRLGAKAVDAALMNQVEVAWTETFVLKDRRHTYHDKHPHPRLSDKVCHLQHISYKGTRFKHLKDAGVITVKDLLTLFYTDPKELEDILKLKASSKIWDDIIKNAHASNGLFLYLDPSNKCKGAVLDVKLQLKALIVEPEQYISVNHLSDQQKVDSQNLVTFASEHFKVLQSFEDETSLKEYIQSGTSFTSSPPAMNQSLGTSKITDEPPTLSSQITYSSCGLTESINNSNFHMGQSTNHIPNLTYQSERGKEKVPLGDGRIYSANYYQEHISLHPPNLEGPNWLKYGAATAHNATEPGTSSLSVESLLESCEFVNTQNIYSPYLEDIDEWFLNSEYNTHLESPNIERHSKPPNADTDVVVLAAETVSVCTIARTRWTKVSKLLRRNSVRERISLSEGIQAPKRQRCC